jgi:hypothetical protein
MTTVLNWNVERRTPHTRQAGVMIERAAARRPDVICLTEAYDGSTASLGGYEIADRGDRRGDQRDRRAHHR